MKNQNSNRPTIAYYITAHGYGHGTRSFDIINALRTIAPEVTVIVKTDLPEAFLRSRLGPNVKRILGAYDIGLAQKDAIRIDLPASKIAMDSFYSTATERIKTEAAWLQANQISAVVADLPAIPLAAAQQIGIPAIASGNFGWDWIYEEFVPQDPSWQTHIDLFRSIYAKTDLLLRLPFAEPMTTFPHRMNIPLLAHPGTPDRDKIIQLTGADPHKIWILLSFASLELDEYARANIAAIPNCCFFSIDPLEWTDSTIHCIHRSDMSFADTLASVDLVVTKPGFGIVSDCIINHKPIIHADRENFREYPILVDHIERCCRHVPITAETLYKGELGAAIEAIQQAPEPLETLPAGGAEIAARAILEKIKSYNR